MHRHEEEMNVRPQDPHRYSRARAKGRRAGAAALRLAQRRRLPRLAARELPGRLAALLGGGESSRRDPVSTHVRRAARRRQRRDDHREGPGNRGHVREGGAVSRCGGARDDQLLDRGARVRGSGGARPAGAGARRRGHRGAGGARDAAVADASSCTSGRRCSSSASGIWYMRRAGAAGGGMFAFGRREGEAVRADEGARHVRRRRRHRGGRAGARRGRRLPPRSRRSTRSSARGSRAACS